MLINVALSGGGGGGWCAGGGAKQADQNPIIPWREGPGTWLKFLRESKGGRRGWSVSRTNWFPGASEKLGLVLRVIGVRRQTPAHEIKTCPLFPPRSIDYTHYISPSNEDASFLIPPWPIAWGPVLSRPKTSPETLRQWSCVCAKWRFWRPNFCPCNKCASKNQMLGCKR